jgi:TRAP transporter 4TM/12TM fusion protein
MAWILLPQAGKDRGAKCPNRCGFGKPNKPGIWAVPANFLPIDKGNCRVKQDTSGEIRERLRSLEGKTSWIVNSTAVVFSLFYIYTAGFGLISTELHRGVYILFTMLLCFMLYPLRKKSPQKRASALDWILCLLVVISVTYWIVEFPDYAAERVRDPTPADIVMGIIITILSLEVARRTINWVLPILAFIFLMYAYFGPYVPGILGHPGFSTVSIVESIACDVGGIYGIVANTYATFVFPFIIFASFLKAAGAGEAIESLALAIAGSTRGGPAKVAVVSSGIIGSITGSSAANAVATGAYTIPLMKKTGYKAHVAAGVEAAASSGGQMLPPVMGAGAFLLATFTETAYVDIIKIAAIPAVLYFFSVGCMVHFIAGREGLQGLPREELPKLKTVILKQGYLLIPVLVILVLLIARYSPQKAAFGAIMCAIALSYVKKETRLGPRKLLETLILAARNSLVVGATAGTVGIIVGITLMAGLGIKFSALILGFSQGLLPLTIFLTAVASYIMGMGLTVTASYVVVSVLAVPALVELSVPLVAAHLIVFWYVETGQVTPPVALAAFAASGIARCDPNKAGFAAVRLASPLLITPVLFVYTTILLNGPATAVIETIASATIGFVAYAGMMQGFWLRRAEILERVLLGLAAVCLFIPSIYTDFAGLAILAAVTVLNRKHEIEQTSER